MAEKLVQFNLHIPESEKEEIKQLAQKLGVSSRYLATNGSKFYGKYLLKQQQEREKMLEIEV